MRSGRPKIDADTLRHLCFVFAREVGAWPANTVTLLSFLADQPGGSALETDAVTQCRVHRSPLSRLRERLVDDGLLTAAKVIEGQRQHVRLTITAAGRNVIGEIIQAAQSVR